MTSQRVTCPNCGATNRKYGGASRKRNHDDNHECSSCGEPLPCPVCQAGKYPDRDVEEDRCAPGYFEGESTGECLPCSFCNQREIAERRRRYGNTRGRV